MAAARSIGPASPSGSFSLGGIAIDDSLRPPESCWIEEIVPVMSFEPGAGAVAGACGIWTEAVGSGAGLLNDCLPIGVGEVICGVTCSVGAGAAPFAAGACMEAGGSLELPIAGEGAGPWPVEPSSSCMAILNEPSTITTTLAATSTERIFEVTLEGSFLSLSVLPLLLARPFSGAACAAAAAWAARRAAAMKLEEETGGLGAAAGISLMAFSDAAIRSDGEAERPPGRVPGSSG